MVIQNSKGNAAAPTIDPSEMCLETATSRTKTMVVSSKASGAMYKNAPIKQATALPPRKPRNNGKQWPSITAKVAKPMARGS